MSTSHGQGAVLYVVSRSGEVLPSEQRARSFDEAGFFEGELEGWIFWGSSKRSTANACSRRCHDAAESDSRGLSGTSLGEWTSRRQRIPFVVWGDERKSVNDTFEPLWERQTRSHGRKNTSRKGFLDGRKTLEVWKDTDAGLEPSIPGSAKPQVLLRSERWCRMEQNLNIGLAQLAILQKWEPGTREVAARWAAWLLKMLRKSRPHPRPLQQLLFTMCSAVLPIFCCSLDREQWSTVPDPELCRCVDIVWKALDKSYACFSPAQWEILQERLIECRQLRMKVGVVTEKYSRALLETLEISNCKIGRLPLDGMLGPSLELIRPRYSARDQQLSNSLVQTEGVPALVQRALHEKLFTPRPKHVGGKGSAGFSGGSGTIVSLICPLSGRRVKVPARGRGCSHSTSFDLQTYLERHVKEDPGQCSSVHQRKKTKMERGVWRCPICGADATWPQVVVDRRLLRILEVLPEHMPEVCLLSDGRWRVVWSPGGGDAGTIETKSNKGAVHSRFESFVNSEIYCIGRFGELRYDVQEPIDHEDAHEESCGCDVGVQIFDKAYRAWEDEVDHLAGGGATEQIEVQWCTDSTVAFWTGDRNSNRDYVRTSTQNLIDPGGSLGEGRKGSTDSVNYTEVEIHPQVQGDVGMISEAEDSRKIEREDDDARMTSRSRLILEALQTLGGMTSAYSGTGGMYTRMRVGQHKARHKVMAKKT